MTTLRYDAGAAAYDRFTGRWSALFATAALDAVLIGPTDRVLDLAAGTGVGTLLAAQRLGRDGAAVAADLSMPMLSIAQGKQSSISIDLVGADAQQLPFADSAFDAAICLFGLMFFPDLPRALSELRRVLKPGGRFAATLWRTPETAPFAGIIAQALGDVMPADRDDLLRPFSMPDPTTVEEALKSANFGNVNSKREVHSARFASFDEYWAPIEAGGGRLGQAYLGLPARLRKVVRDRVWDELVPLTRNGEIAMEVEAHLVVGR